VDNNTIPRTKDLHVVERWKLSDSGNVLEATRWRILGRPFSFAPAVFDFSITEWEDLLGLATFGIIGALVGLLIHEFFILSE
jgi:hypothetical protein